MEAMEKMLCFRRHLWRWDKLRRRIEWSGMDAEWCVELGSTSQDHQIEWIRFLSLWPDIRTPNKLTWLSQ